MTVDQIPENMLQALYAMADESASERPYIHDKKAVEIVKKLEETLEGGKNSYNLSRGALVRTILLDRLTADYIRKNPDARVINIACGMDTRFYRVDNGRIRWYDLDLPEAVEARRLLLPEGERNFLIGKSAFDNTWPEDVEGEGPVLILVERLTMYLDDEKVRKLFDVIGAHFPQAEVFVEIASPYTVENTFENIDGSSRPKYTWGVKNGRRLRKLAAGFKVVRDVSMMEGLKRISPVYHVLRFFPPLRKISNKIVILRGKG